MKRGRPARPLAATFRDVEQLLTENPGISANEVALRLRLRRRDAGLILRGLRNPNGHPAPFPNPDRGA